MKTIQMKIYAIGALALITFVGGTIYLNDQEIDNTPLIKSEPQIEPISNITIPAIQPIIESTPPISEEPSITPTEPIVESSLVQEIDIIEEVPAIEIPKKEPLPTLDNSDNIFMAKASNLSWLPAFAKQLIKKDLARNFVTFVDNLSRGDLALKYSPIKKPATKFSISEIDNDMYINPLSYKRYDAYVDMINSINVDMAIKHLNELNPLLDEAYMELGYEQGTFFITLEQAIDEMLQTPVIRNPIKVVAPSAMYKYDDPQLESLPEAQKLMLRMGPDNITKLRPKLQQIQVSLSALSQ